jgi:hypothetical protein
VQFVQPTDGQAHDGAEVVEDQNLTEKRRGVAAQVKFEKARVEETRKLLFRFKG